MYLEFCFVRREIKKRDKEGGRKKSQFLKCLKFNEWKKKKK